MDGASVDLDDNVMKMLVSRDLFMNVYKNGVWGSYQHLPLEPGIINASILLQEIVHG